MPIVQDGAHVAPLANVVVDGDPHRLFDPGLGVRVLGLAQVFGDHRRQRPDVLLVESVDRRPDGAHVRGTPGRVVRPPLAALKGLDGRPTLRAVEEVYVPLVVDAHQQQAAARHGPVQGFRQRRLARLIGPRHRRQKSSVAGQFDSRQPAEGPLLARQSPDGVERNLQLAEMVDRGE